MTSYRLIPLDDTVVFPGMTVTLSVDPGTDSRVLLVPRRGDAFAKVGVVAEVAERVKLGGRGFAVSLTGLHRAMPGAASTGRDGHLRVVVDERPDVAPPATLTHELEREYRAVVEELLQLRGDDGRISAFLRSITGAGPLADTAGYSPDIPVEQKIDLLETLDVVERLAMSVRLQKERLTELQLRKRIREDVDSGAQKQQREYFLNRQMDAIRKELGQNEASVAEEYRKKIAAAGMPEKVLQQAERELSRFERMGDSNAESSMIRTYLDWLLAVPWSKRSEERLDPLHARQVLDADHAGLDDVKSRITEYLAVRKLRADRGLSDDKRSGAILTLVGPPGTGKTSIGESIARATGRQFVRMSLGGVRDEAEIRGHRRTYIGALPGRLVRALRDAGTMNPVILLDEVDKLGADWRGDPSSALLEVLDPAQNHALQDHYLDVALDLSHVLFIAAVHLADTNHEAAARTAVPGVATGLAVTGVGGDVLFVEAATMAGKGGLVLTGQLGDVMKESARIALTYVQSHARQLGIDERAFDTREFHVHVPAGAIPKDGPSAGVTMVTALASLLTGRPVKSTVGMTGEVTLQGRVLPIGGLKQKVLAAHAAGLTTIILPERNEPDLDEVPLDVRQHMQFHPVQSVEEVLALALEPNALAMVA